VGGPAAAAVVVEEQLQVREGVQAWVCRRRIILENKNSLKESYFAICAHDILTGPGFEVGAFDVWGALTPFGSGVLAEA
jgi:hypothetical protein